MKMKLLAISLLAMAVLAGCSSKTEVEKKEEPEIKQVKVSEEDYPKKIQELNLSMDDGFKNLGLIAQEDPNSENRNKRMDEQIEIIQKAVHGFKGIIAPEKYKDIHGQYLDAMKFYEKGLDTLLKANREKDSELWSKGTETIKEGFTILAKAHTKLSDMQPVGDGTITNKDLKDLDAKAGIDRDSVTNNISTDGKELVGKWGTAGSTPSIVLNADGSYEGYREGTYPSRDNMTKGTWTYDYEKRGLFFTNEETYSNGKKSTVAREYMIMDIQSFKDGKMKLMDIESLNTFNYVKYE